MYVKQDMGLWKELLWEETKPSNTRIIICLRTGTSPEDINNKPWKYCFQSTLLESGTIDHLWIHRNLLMGIFIPSPII
jgi:hypothetical protein